jgi:hypothetical protein
MTKYVKIIAVSTNSGDMLLKNKLPAKAGRTPVATRSGILKASGSGMLPICSIT